MRSINYRPSFTYASSTNSPDVRSALSPGGCVADPLAEFASDTANQRQDTSAQVTPEPVQEEKVHNSCATSTLTTID